MRGNHTCRLYIHMLQIGHQPASSSQAAIQATQPIPEFGPNMQLSTHGARPRVRIINESRSIVSTEPTDSTTTPSPRAALFSPLDVPGTIHTLLQASAGSRRDADVANLAGPTNKKSTATRPWWYVSVSGRTPCMASHMLIHVYVCSTRSILPCTLQLINEVGVDNVHPCGAEEVLVC